MSAAAEECERLVREQDPDRAVSLSFAPADRRPHLAALYAFNIETAKVREQISQPLPGEIRLQWWRDRILGENQSGSGNPVAEALLAAIRETELPRDAFDRLIEARIFDLYDDPMPSREAFEAYAGETAAALVMLAAMILDRSAATQVADAAGHAGVAQAAAGILRLLPIHRRRGQIYIPADILAAAGCSPEELLRGDAAPSSRAIAAMTAFGREHFEAYLARSRLVPTSLRPAFLPADLSASYLSRIERAGVANIDRPVGIGPFRRSFAYWQAMRR